jgi:hypothetical protein
MSETENSDPEAGTEEDEQPTGWTCKRCKHAKVYHTKEEQEAHRKWHLKQKAGPASKKRNRRASPTPSSMTLFSVVQLPTAAEKKKEDQRKRKEKAVEQQKKNQERATKGKTKNNGG